MKLFIDAVFENGIFRPLQGDAVQFPDGKQVRLTVEDDALPETLQLAAKVYERLSSDQIDEIERIALDRSNFFREPRSTD